MRRYTKFTPLLSSNKKPFTDKFKKMSEKHELKQEKENKDHTNKGFMEGFTEKFNMAAHKVSKTFDWVTNKIGFKKLDDTQHQNVNSSINSKEKPTYYDLDKNQKEKGHSDTSFDIHKMGVGTMEGQSKDNDSQKGGNKSKLDLKFGGGSSYGSSRIGNYADQKPSSQESKGEKREYSTPNAGSVINESGSQASRPMNEPNRSSIKNPSESHEPKQ